MACPPRREASATRSLNSGFSPFISEYAINPNIQSRVGKPLRLVSQGVKPRLRDLSNFNSSKPNWGFKTAIGIILKTRMFIIGKVFDQPRPNRILMNVV
jgi:hypothetical protein